MPEAELTGVRGPGFGGRPESSSRSNVGRAVPGPPRLRIALAFIALLASAACKKAEPPAHPPSKVVVATPVVKDVVEWDEYTARLEAIDSVEVRARVSGFLEQVRFKEGALVHKGDLLYVIDARPYEAIVRKAEADLNLAKARRELAQKRYDRAVNLVAKNAISKEEADTRAAEARSTEAAVQSAQAAVEATKLDVEFTQVHAPVGGRVGRKLVTEGNLINGGSGSQGTLLTTIVSLDPIHVYFDVDEAAYLKYTRLARDGSRPSSRDTPNPVQIGFGDEEGFPHTGEMDFVDNRIDENTGTLIGRAILPNPDLMLTPGLFARLRLVGSGKYRAVLIEDEAVAHDQSQSFVYVVNDKNEAEYRRIKTGPLIDGLRVVREGLKGDERIVVAGIQRVHPGNVVAPEERSTPTAKATP